MAIWIRRNPDDKAPREKYFIPASFEDKFLVLNAAIKYKDKDCNSKPIKAVKKLLLEIRTNEPRIAKSINNTYSYLYKFSFFKGLFNSKMNTIEPIDKIILDKTNKLIVLSDNCVE